VHADSSNPSADGDRNRSNHYGDSNKGRGNSAINAETNKKFPKMCPGPLQVAELEEKNVWYH